MSINFNRRYGQGCADGSVLTYAWSSHQKNITTVKVSRLSNFVDFLHKDASGLLHKATKCDTQHLMTISVGDSVNIWVKKEEPATILKISIKDDVPTLKIRWQENGQIQKGIPVGAVNSKI